MALLLYGGLSAFALIVWFRASGSPNNWRAMLTMLGAVGSFGTSALLWREPSKPVAAAAIVVMLASVGRIGSPDQWTGFSFSLVAITAILLVPVINAFLSARSNA